MTLYSTSRTYGENLAVIFHFFGTEASEALRARSARTFARTRMQRNHPGRDSSAREKQMSSPRPRFVPFYSF